LRHLFTKSCVALNLQVIVMVVLQIHWNALQDREIFSSSPIYNFEIKKQSVFYGGKKR